MLSAFFLVCLYRWTDENTSNRVYDHKTLEELKTAMELIAK